MKTNNKSPRLLALIALAASVAAGSPAAMAQTDLADQPLFTTTAVPGNLALTPSVEYPTAISVANMGNFSATVDYVGYFDPKKCYVYVPDAAIPANSYFRPDGLAAANHACPGKWSGSFLNWATMQTIDPFRWALTGGYRVVDEPGRTILEKAWGALIGDNGNFPNRGTNGNDNPTTGDRLAPSLVSSVTPFAWTGFNMRIWGCGNRLVFTGAGSVSSCTGTDWTNQTDAAAQYQVYVRVQVCDPTSGRGGVEANCKPYGSNYKPEGLMQQYAMRIRYSAFGYLNDSDIQRDGAALRARMKFIGPERPVPGSANLSNDLAEWDASTGVFVRNPDSSDATASAVSDSGVMNYLNKFGQASHTYKTFDPVSEMYYAATRYFRNLGNVSSYTSGAQANATFKDGFPVIDFQAGPAHDPILYSCQKNFILGIGDANTHADSNLPGAGTPPRSGNEPSMPAEVSADTTVNAATATNKVGELEGMGSGLGGRNIPWCCNNNSYLMAGLAYDSHTKDIRPDQEGKQTISTYWVDVLENQIYRGNNQYYLATKYGGFDVPTDFGDPYARTTPLDQAWWNTAGETNPNTGQGTNLRPKNYFTGGQAETMVLGLQSAFARIVSEMKAFTTSFATPAPQVSTSGNASYSAQFDAETWTGELTASTISFNATTGAPTVVERWRASDMMALQFAGNGWDIGRLVVTWNPSSGSSGEGVPFRHAELNATQATALDPAWRTGNDSAQFVNYLRGDRTLEAGSAYRLRTRLLGDIVGSRVRPVGPPNMPYSNAANPGYAAFKQAHASRPAMVYVGANDGMLHAFNGALTGTDAGKEVFAYIPSALFQGPNGTPQVDGLVALGNPDFQHHYYVNSTPQVFDIDFSKTQGASGGADWHSVLIGGLGKGGKSYYAIDVTDPATMASETAVADRVLWEFSHADMGLSYGEPTVVKTRKYGWTVIFASGYGNSDGKGYIFFVNPRNGELLERVQVSNLGTTTSEAGLAHVAAYVLDLSDGVADAVYGGDLMGNVWRLDITATSGNYPAPLRLATLATAGGSAQPVTSRPLIEVQPSTGKRFVFIGTGRLLADTDANSTQGQTFYAIWDGTGMGFNAAANLPPGVNFPVDRSELANNTNLIAGVAVNPSTPMGWYVDLGAGAQSIAFRVVTDPASFFGVVSFTAVLPNGNACAPSGSSRVYAVEFGSGKSVLLQATEPIAYSEHIAGVVTDVRFLSVNGKVRLVVGSDTGQVGTLPGNFGAAMALRRLNWRELPTTN